MGSLQPSTCHQTSRKRCPHLPPFCQPEAATKQTSKSAIEQWQRVRVELSPYPCLNLLPYTRLAYDQWHLLPASRPKFVLVLGTLSHSYRLCIHVCVCVHGMCVQRAGWQLQVGRRSHPGELAVNGWMKGWLNVTPCVPTCLDTPL